MDYFCFNNHGYAKIIRDNTLRFIWKSRSHFTNFMGCLHTPDMISDIFLEDYFEDLSNPTETELTLLLLEHNIIYDWRN